MTELFVALKRIWPFVRPYRLRLVGIFFTGLAIAACSAAMPKLANILLHDVFEGHDVFWTRWLPFTFPVLYLFWGIVRYLNMSMLILTADQVAAEFRKRLLSKFMRLNVGFHNSFEGGSGGLISRVLNDTTILQAGFYFFGDLVREPLSAIALLSYMIYLDWKLTTFALLFLPIIIPITRQVSRSLRKYGHKSRDAMEEMTSSLKESLDGLRVIQSFNLESEMDKRFGGTVDHFLEIRKKIISREEAVGPVNEFLMSILVASIIYYMIGQVLSAQAPPSSFVTFLLAAGLLQVPIKRLQDAAVRAQQTFVVVERLFEILENTSSVPQIANPCQFPPEWKTITFRDVSFRYGTDMVLKNVNLTIYRGELIALVGESGSGKSTLVNLLGRFFDPTSGEIRIDDIPLGDFDVHSLRSNIALVTQDVFLFRDTIARNIHAGNFDKDPAGIEPASKLANAHTFIQATPKQYSNAVGERGNLLSGGEKQRVSIARAIFKDAPILILDEATSALDSVSEMEVQKGLNHLLEGRTAFVIAHRLSTVFNADRILVMKKGEIVEQGTHRTLIEQKGEYHNFFELQMNHEGRARQGLS
jgi:subfamily B ATP-binding cassette protein MsbA